MMFSVGLSDITFLIFNSSYISHITFLISNTCLEFLSFLNTLIVVELRPLSHAFSALRC